ncbi:hypothetical protein ACFQBY_00905 [Promicromonospora citrea]|uniref:Secreted protein n=1 Tax=Promicromonospora citrea TaxID=43677 RepID=A0A8H9GQ05_9MICO|nr:hypothetical protein [Promicromonospora citrea]NNH53084.1 hypothetical protein [Promicromonospora citrea]GGM44215.1 hypothetical protein GCM10010102_44600 [Promicromonospora citrea]
MRKNGQTKRVLTAAFGIALGASMLTASPAAAAQQIAHTCVGEEVIRCANVEMTKPGVFNAHARVTDSEGGGDYEVRVRAVYLETLRDGIWWTVAESYPEHDPWEPVQDVERTASWACKSSEQVRIRAKVSLEWQDENYVGNAGILYSNNVKVCPRA